MKRRAILSGIGITLAMWLSVGGVGVGGTGVGGAWSGGGGVALAQEGDSLAELRQRFRERYPELLRATRAGRIGETWRGFSAPVEELDPRDERDQALRELIAQENADRRKLYQIIAERQDTTAELVAQRNAKRNFEKAEPGDYLKGRNGHWYRKPAEDEGDS